MQKSRRDVVKLLSMVAGVPVLTWHTRAGAWTAGQLTVWVNADKGHEGLRRVAEAYAQRSGRKVVVQHFEQAVDRFEAVMKEGGQGGPDIWIWPHDRIGDWIQRGWIAPVQPSEPVRSDIVQVAWDGFTQGGKIWGYPLSVEAVALVYNKALVAQPPASFEEVLALHEKLKPKGIRALGWETGSPYFTWPLMAAGGAYVFQRRIDGSYEPRDTGINHPGAVRAGQYLQQLMAAGVIPQGGLSYSEAEADMQDGQQAMWITGPWAWEGLKSNGIDFGVAPLPTLGGRPARPFVGVLGAMVVEGSPHRAQAIDFIENHLLKPESLQRINADKPLGVPASRRMFWSQYADARVRASMEAIYAGRPMPSNSEMTWFWQHLSAALREINSGTRGPREALDAAAAQIRALASQGRPVASR